MKKISEFEENIKLLESLGLTFDTDTVSENSHIFLVRTLSGQLIMKGSGECCVGWLNKNMVFIKQLISYRLNPIPDEQKQRLEKSWKEWNDKWEKSGNNIFERFTFHNFLVEKLTEKTLKPIIEIEEN